MLEQERAAWAAAVRLATERTGASEDKFEWIAIVAPDGESLNSHFDLHAETRVGPLRLVPGGVQSVEWRRRRNWMPNASGASVNVVYPAVVYGASRGYSWERSLRSAARSLHRLRSIMSIAWDADITIVDSPQPANLDERQVPRFLGVPPRDDVAEQTFENWAHESAPLPVWVDEAWTTLIGPKTNPAWNLQMPVSKCYRGP